MKHSKYPALQQEINPYHRHEYNAQDHHQRLFAKIERDTYFFIQPSFSGGERHDSIIPEHSSHG